MAMLPQTNARVTAITGGGAPRQYGAAATPGGAKWSGDEPAYYMDKVHSTIAVDSGALVRVIDSTLIVPPDLATIRAGDHVTYKLGTASYTREIADISAPRAPAGGMLHTYTRLHLVPANA